MGETEMTAPVAPSGADFDDSERNERPFTDSERLEHLETMVAEIHGVMMALGQMAGGMGLALPGVGGMDSAALMAQYGIGG